MNLTEIRSQFPALSAQVYGRPLVYLDNAATAQRPLSVEEAWRHSVETANANIHRAVHYLAGAATDAYESARESVRAFLNAALKEEIVFTSGATLGINLVAHAFGEAFVGEGDEVIVSVDGHHSNIVPWQLLCGRKKAVLKVLDIHENGSLAVEDLEKIISRRTKIVAISHISNVLGLINPGREIVEICHRHGVPVLVDGAQGVVHAPVDVQALDCDFYVFSGHKLYAATGTGVLYGKKKWLEAMPPFLSGGEMIHTVRFDGTTFAPLPFKFEAGTQHINGVPTWEPALAFVRTCREQPDVEAEQAAILDYVYEKLTEDERVILYGVPRGTKIPLFSFAVRGVHHEDLALLLDKMGIAVRSGQMCAEPLMDRLGVSGLLRASFAPYNTLAEAESFIAGLHKAINMLV